MLRHRATRSLVIALVVGGLAASCSDDESPIIGDDAGTVDAAGDIGGGGDTDAGEPDGGELDSGEPDGGEPDGGEPDGGEPDGGEPDGGEPDGGHVEVHWSYDGETGPEFWGELDEAWATCGEGTEQSPIDIPQLDLPAGLLEDLTSAEYLETSVTILNNGHTVQVNCDAGSTIVLGGVEYTLKQFHFHAASEHTLDGEHMPMEMHLVHEAADGSLAVVGRFIDEGAENTALAGVFANMPAEEQTATVIDGATVPGWELLPEEPMGWHYDGSLTTPGCTEGVSWYVVEETLEASPEQIGAFTDIFDHNYRPTQR